MKIISSLAAARLSGRGLGAKSDMWQSCTAAHRHNDATAPALLLTECEAEGLVDTDLLWSTGKEGGRRTSSQAGRRKDGRAIHEMALWLAGGNRPNRPR